MKRMYHPNIRDLAIEVEDDAVEAHAEQGWRKTPRPEPGEKGSSTTKSEPAASGKASQKGSN